MTKKTARFEWKKNANNIADTDQAVTYGCAN